MIFSAVKIAAAGAALLAGCRWYCGGWPGQLGKCAVRLSFWRQRMFYHQLRPCCDKHGGKHPCLALLSSSAQQVLPPDPLGLVVLVTESAKCVRNYLSVQLPERGRLTGVQLTYRHTTLLLHSWILEELGAAPPKDADAALKMLEECLPAGCSIVIHDYRFSLISSIALPPLQHICKQKNIAMILVRNEASWNPIEPKQI